MTKSPLVLDEDDDEHVLLDRTDSGVALDYIEMSEIPKGYSPPSPSYYGSGVIKCDKMEMNEMVEIAGFGWFQWLHITLLGMIYLGDAAELSLNSVILSTLACEWNLTPFQQGVIPFTTLGVQCIGSVIGGIMSDKYGRRTMLIVNLWALLLFSILSTLSTDFWWYLITRACVGICVGSNTASGVTYSFEIVPISKRAFTMFVLSSWWILGSAYEYMMGYFIMNSYSWKVQVLLTALPALIGALGVFFIKESPRYLYITGDMAGANAAMRRMFRMNNKVLPQNDLYVQVEPIRGRLQDVFSTEYLRTTLILMQVFFINAFLCYGQSYLIVNIFYYGYCDDTSPSWIDSNVTDNITGTVAEISCTLTSDDYLYMSLINALAVPASLVGFMMSDRMGRTSTMFLAAILISLILIPMLFCFGQVIIMIQLCLFAFVTMFQNMALWTFMPEVYPTYVRNAAVGFINGQGKIGAAIGALITQMFSTYSVKLVIYIYLGLSLYQFLIIILFQVETKDSPLKDQRDKRESDKILYSKKSNVQPLLDD